MLVVCLLLLPYLFYSRTLIITFMRSIFVVEHRRVTPYCSSWLFVSFLLQVLPLFEPLLVVLKKLFRSVNNRSISFAGASAFLIDCPKPMTVLYLPYEVSSCPHIQLNRQMLRNAEWFTSIAVTLISFICMGFPLSIFVIGLVNLPFVFEKQNTRSIICFATFDIYTGIELITSLHLA